MNKFLLNTLLITFIQVTQSQQLDVDKFDIIVENAIALSEKALYNTKFDEALLIVDNSYFKNFSNYKRKHKIALTVQSIRIQSFQSRLYLSPFNSDEHLSNLIGLLPDAKQLDDDRTKAKYFTTLSALYSSKNLELCILYEKQALKLFTKLADYKSLAELRATQISRHLSSYISNKKKEKAIDLIPKFREEIKFSSKHSKYALSYNTRHLANIYRVYNLDLGEALKLYKKSLTLREEIRFKPFIAASYYSLGLVYSNLDLKEEAIKAFNKSIELAEEVGFIRYKCVPHFEIGDIYLAKGDKKQAIKYYANALKSASVNKYLVGINAALEKLSKIKE